MSIFLDDLDQIARDEKAGNIQPHEVVVYQIMAAVRNKVRKDLANGNPCCACGCSCKVGTTAKPPA